MRRPFLLALCCLLPLLGCDAPVTPRAPTSRPTRTVVEIRSIVQLPPNRNVRLVVDTAGNVCYSIETSAGTDVMFVVNESGIPSATQLTAARIIALLGEPGGTGRIQSLCAGPRGAIWFFFVGSKGWNIRACIGQYSLRDNAIRVVYDTAQIKSASGMGDSIELARGTLTPAGKEIFFLLRHTDTAGIFRFDAAAGLSPTTPPLARVLEEIRVDEKPIRLTQADFELAPSDQAMPLLMDRSSGEVLQINPDGSTRSKVLLMGLPREISPPLPTKGGRLIFFAADSELLKSERDMSRGAFPNISYPAIVLHDGKQFTLIDRNDLRAPPGVAGYALRINALAAAPDGSFVGYDQSSGQLLRLRLSQVVD